MNEAEQLAFSSAPVETSGLRSPGVTIMNGKGAPLSVLDAGDDGACFKLWRELSELAAVARFTIDGEPVSKSRARFTNRGSKTRAYTPEKTHTAELAIGWTFRASARGHVLDREATYGVMALFFCGTRQRRDVDNMLKLVLDGLNGVAWPDDEQVTEVSARKALVLPEEARTEVLVYRVGAVQRFMAACENCGREFPVFQARAGGSRKRYCSKECAAAGKRMPPKAVECKGCGKTFVVDRAHARQVYCSEECAKGRATVECTGCGTEFTKQRCHVRAKNFCSTACRDTSAAERRTQAAKGTCETCGGPTSKKSYRQCQACSWNGKPTSGKPITEVTG